MVTFSARSFHHKSSLSYILFLLKYVWSFSIECYIVCFVFFKFANIIPLLLIDINGSDRTWLESWRITYLKSSCTTRRWYWQLILTHPSRRCQHVLINLISVASSFMIYYTCRHFLIFRLVRMLCTPITSIRFVLYKKTYRTNNEKKCLKISKLLK